ncbi:excalibur calcium-binding domain-containing protein [Kineococcus sp. SYSU DK002]|uniref:excalibur calcium-binding domain-containing protein n=1 Tax=Kineococcus sp. SYSU DK002 TaxID=3383123 RepID=UPI003D7DB6E2
MNRAPSDGGSPPPVSAGPPRLFQAVVLVSGCAAGVWTVMAGRATTVLPGGLIAAGSVLALVGLLAVISGRQAWAAIWGRVPGLVLVAIGGIAVAAGYLLSGPALPADRTIPGVALAAHPGSVPPATQDSASATSNTSSSANSPASTADGNPGGSQGGYPGAGEHAQEPAVFYTNCAAVRAAGAAPIHPGDTGWRAAFDRDGDGVGCE